jgi:hypothetical protein
MTCYEGLGADNMNTGEDEDEHIGMDFPDREEDD